MGPVQAPFQRSSVGLRGMLLKHYRTPWKPCSKPRGKAAKLTAVRSTFMVAAAAVAAVLNVARVTATGTASALKFERATHRCGMPPCTRG